MTFTHETTLDDFTLELPASDAPLRYGSLGAKRRRCPGVRVGREFEVVLGMGDDRQEQEVKFTI